MVYAERGEVEGRIALHDLRGRVALFASLDRVGIERELEEQSVPIESGAFDEEALRRNRSMRWRGCGHVTR
jgi:hypothetical protein